MVENMGLKSSLINFQFTSLQLGADYMANFRPGWNFSLSSGRKLLTISYKDICDYMERVKTSSLVFQTKLEISSGLQGWKPSCTGNCSQISAQAQLWALAGALMVYVMKQRW